jgi:hypothetical protein
MWGTEEGKPFLLQTIDVLILLSELEGGIMNEGIKIVRSPFR